MASSPQSGHQVFIKYCPNCKGDLRAVASQNQSVRDTHRYRCDVCTREFEVNDCSAGAIGDPRIPA